MATELEQAVSGNDGITCRLGGGLFGTLFVGALRLNKEPFWT